MNDGFSVEVHRSHPVVMISPRGVLDAYTAPDLRAGLMQCLAEQPAGVLIDASELTVADDVGLAVVATVAQQSERWPGTKFAIAPSTPELTVALTRMGIDRHVSLCPTLAVAHTELSRLDAPPLLRRHIKPDRDAPGLARAAVVEFCEQQSVLGSSDAAQLVASELVTNAVVHAGTSIELTLRLVAPLLHIAVRDGGAGRPRIAGVVDESSETGRGLLLVDALAASWGSIFPDAGKVVWATVKVRTGS
jgi:anti-anti-sigma regulatory factor